MHIKEKMKEQQPINGRDQWCSTEFLGQTLYGSTHLASRLQAQRFDSYNHLVVALCGPACTVASPGPGFVGYFSLLFCPIIRLYIRNRVNCIYKAKFGFESVFGSRILDYNQIIFHLAGFLLSNDSSNSIHLVNYISEKSKSNLKLCHLLG